MLEYRALINLERIKFVEIELGNVKSLVILPMSEIKYISLNYEERKVNLFLHKTSWEDEEFLDSVSLYFEDFHKYYCPVELIN